MISKIIDSKPEELRTYLEEAAGISKYKEKRRETELRLKHTSENLSRLKDIMREITSSLTKLQKQANDAELYKQLKKDEESIKIKIIGKKIIGFDVSLDSIKKYESDLLLQSDKYNSEMTGFNTEIDNLKFKREDEQTIYNRIQSESFQVAAEIARAEKDIEYTEQIETSKKDNIEDINSDIEKAKKEIKELNEKKEHNVSELKKSIEENHRLSISIDDINKNIKDSSFALQNWQSNFNKFLSDKIELEKEIELEKSKIESFSENISSLKKRLDQYSDMSDRNDETNIQVELLDLSESYQKQLINFKVDQERYSKGLPNNERKSLSNLLNNLIDKFKTIIIKIKENNKSLDQQRKEIKKNIKSYQDKITNCEGILLGYNTNLKNFTEHKNKLEKQKIDLKQAYDKSNWKLMSCLKT